jgi:hypothetical protein
MTAASSASFRIAMKTHPRSSTKISQPSWLVQEEGGTRAITYHLSRVWSARQDLVGCTKWKVQTVTDLTSDSEIENQCVL